MHEDSFALRTLDILRRRIVLAVVVFAAVLAATVSVALNLPDLYRANALVLVERQMAESVIRPAVIGELETRLHVIKQEILSRDRLTELVNRFNLYPELRSRATMEEILEQTRQDIKVDLTGPEQVAGRTKTVAFRLGYTGRQRETVADVTNAIAAFYVAQNELMRSQEAAHTTEFLRQQLEEAKKHLDQQERNVRAYTTTHSGGLPEQVNVNLATLDRLNTQLRLNGEQKMRVLDQRERLLDGLRVPGGQSARAADQESPTERLERMKENLQQLETRFTSRHPDVVRLREEIAALERGSQMQEVVVERSQQVAEQTTAQARRRTVDSFDAEIERLEQEGAVLRQNISALEQRLEAVPERQQEIELITRDRSTAKEMYDTLVKRYEDAQLVKSMETDRQGERFRVLETAIAPEGPNAPNRVRLMILGFLLALMASMILVLVVEQFDTSFHSVDDLREFTSVPVLSSIPRIDPYPLRRRLRLAFGAVSVLAAVALIAVLSAHFASGNEQLVRIFVRG